MRWARGEVRLTTGRGRLGKASPRRGAAGASRRVRGGRGRRGQAGLLRGAAGAARSSRMRGGGLRGLVPCERVGGDGERGA